MTATFQVSRWGRRKRPWCRSPGAAAHLFLWDEPLNDIDPESREQIEEMLLETNASMVFIEHERAFIDRVATRELRLGAGKDSGR